MSSRERVIQFHAAIALVVCLCSCSAGERVETPTHPDMTGDTIEQDTKLQRVFGPIGRTFERRRVALDLDDDGRPEQIILLFDTRRGSDTDDVDASSLLRGVHVDGFEVYCGSEPGVLLFYAFQDYGGYSLRFGRVDDQQLLISDGGRDHTQHVWGWWRERDSDWRPDSWQARERVWDVERNAYGRWYDVRRVFVNQGK